MAETAVSVVVPALDAAATIATQLDALAAQDADVGWEVVVVDNGSTDATVEVCRTYAAVLPSLRVISCTTPGTSAARNAGAAAAFGKLLLFCDADDQVAPGWLAAMTRALTHTDADAAGGAIENDLLNPGSQPYLPRHPDHLPVVAGFLPRAITANLAVRRDAFEALGGFAPEYDYGGPDTEFCWRLQLAGFRLAYAPDAVVHYRHRHELRAVARKAYRTGISRGRLFRDYARHGMPRPRLVGVLVRWAGLAAQAPVALLSPRVRWRWTEQASAAAGRVSGSVRFRVLYL
ncbi:glycosyltransferase [Georgenia yuyongxinii]|uniref:Glycosyltransferase n=1 Tax=Georgenia yuyongxinii TaxID=2589797 RepID=A0A5B8C1E9_9MICO|nr:glycosyltransferase [Georgenia yuyongxinii]QDC23917.1 glycosyltransferase [Georgenia yuyongxinii]